MGALERVSPYEAICVVSGGCTELKQVCDNDSDVIDQETTSARLSQTMYRDLGPNARVLVPLPTSFENLG